MILSLEIELRPTVVVIKIDANLTCINTEQAPMSTSYHIPYSPEFLQYSADYKEKLCFDLLQQLIFKS